MRTTYFVLAGFAIGLLLFGGGCQQSEEEYLPVEKGVEVVEEHAHGHEHDHGPHDGHLIELGDHDFHAELVFDEETKTITVYVLGHEPEDAHAIDSKELALNLMIDEKPAQFILTAVAQEGDPEGKSSRFVLAGDEQIAEHIHDEEDLHGRVNVKIDRKDYSGEIAHDHGHDEEEHAHEDDHDHEDEDEHEEGHEHEGEEHGEEHDEDKE